jgi:phosphoglycolate phosphatase-like HAD superfamily hydrolase
MVHKDTVILWDVDGTLIDTHGAGAVPFQTSIEKNLEINIEFNRSTLSGRTDFEIVEILTQLSTSKKEHAGRFETILLDYTIGLKDNLSRKSAHVLGDSKYTLEFLSESMNFRNGILSGNCKDGGVAKLTSGNIYELFHKDLLFFSTFSLSSRIKILESVLKVYPNVLLVGDTPNDVQAAKQFGIPIISVATGVWSYDQLQEINKGNVLMSDWKSQDFTQLLSTIID